MIARGVLTVVLAAALALAAAAPSSAAMRPCGKASKVADGFDTGARLAVKGGWDCSAANEVFAAWTSLVRQAGMNARTAPDAMEVGGVMCVKRTGARRVTLRCKRDGNAMRARWKR